jgi:hypothetical protein
MIKVNGYTSGITVSGEICKERGIELVENNTTSGSSTFTITEDGTYLIVVSNSYQGSRSITLPQGRTATINQDVETTYGMTIVVADLQENDVVTMSATPSTWAAFSKQIYKLTNINTGLVQNKVAKNDGSQTFSVPTSGDFLVVGLCFGRTSADYRDDTAETKAAKSISREVGANTNVNVYADKGENIPTLDLYGYDGGGAFFISINI